MQTSTSLFRRFMPVAAAAVFGLTVAGFSGSALAADDTVLATVGGAPITETDVKMALEDLASQFARVPEDKRRAAALQALIEIRTVAAKARADGLDKTDAFKAQLAFLTDRVLHQQVIDKDVAGAITDAEIRARYDQEVAARPAENEVHARHILVDSEDEAKKLIAELDGGADFEKLAGEHTNDPSGKTSGGDLGWFGKGMMVPEFETAAFALDPGSYTKTPVKSQFGWHIIKVEDKRVKQPPAFEQVADQVRAVLIREKYSALLADLEKNETVEILDPALKADLKGGN